MKLEIIDRDLLTATGDAILLPIDGELGSRIDETTISRALGRIARDFARAHPDCCLLEEIDAQVAFPLRLGSAASVELPEGSPFRFAILLSMLAHDSNRTSEPQLRAIIAGALESALSEARTLGCTTIFTPLLKGGWRIASAEAALSIMLGVFSTPKSAADNATAVICVHDEPGGAEPLRMLARGFGFR